MAYVKHITDGDVPLVNSKISNSKKKITDCKELMNAIHNFMPNDLCHI